MGIKACSLGDWDHELVAFLKYLQMARYLKNSTGVDPFTSDQLQFVKR